jgi:radical SAM protein with 4Fe4S-binding SPASM domain
MSTAARDIRADEVGRPVPIYAVWELTLRCDHACSHCGSRATKARPDELDDAQLYDVADQLIRLGMREVTLIGGEAYLHPECVGIVRHLSQGGVRVTMQTGGRGFTDKRARPLAEAGLAAVGVSIDGMEAEHDQLRASVGSWRAALGALDAARNAGMIVTTNSQINRWNRHSLPGLVDLLRERGVRAWRGQLTVPMGRAADQPDMILQPWMILDVMDTLAALQLREVERARAAGLPPSRAMRIQAGNNVGYYGPHEVTLRSRPGGDAAWWQGCKAGTYTLGIESDGTVKGCPSLPTAPYVGGNVRDISLDALWNHDETIGFTRHRTTDELWGFCKTCEYADTCRAGCSFTAHATLGRRGNMPFCYHRAHTLRQRGVRERLVPVQAAQGLPYDFGRFEIIEEDWPT